MTFDGLLQHTTAVGSNLLSIPLKINAEQPRLQPPGLETNTLALRSLDQDQDLIIRYRDPVAYLEIGQGGGHKKVIQVTEVAQLGPEAEFLLGLWERSPRR